MQARLAQLVERKALNLVVVGSSPTVGVLFSLVLESFGVNGSNTNSTTVGLEPTIFGSEDRRLIHWATRPRRANAHPHGIRVNCALLFLTKSFLCAKGARSTKNVTAVGFEPTPFRTSA